MQKTALKIEACEPAKQLVDKINRLGLNAPCLFFLEAHKPLRGVASALFPSVEPFFRILGARKLSNLLETSLSSAEEYENLISLLEEASKEASSEGC